MNGRIDSRARPAFTLIEVLVVTALITLLMGILLPTLGRARIQAKVLAVHAELRDIGLALEAYAMDNRGLYPPTRVDCMLGSHFYPLPAELAESRYLPPPNPTTFLSAGIEDRFNAGYTYKYRSTGTLIYNRTTVLKEGASLWVPDGFPHGDTQDGRLYTSPGRSPVSWVLFSLGPGFDQAEELRLKRLNYPVPKATWFDPRTKKGVIVRMRLANGTQIGSF
ncbi:MAG: type II secretion system protein [Phycisphaerae bacterium]|nr:type II secretion system protein [Phycisphaerae bacterium]